jgi:hypothetical protein
VEWLVRGTGVEPRARDVIAAVERLQARACRPTARTGTEG